MSLSIERAAMQGRLAATKEEKRKLVLKAASLCNQIRQALNTALHEVEDMDVATADALMDDLLETSGEIAARTGTILKLEKELA